MAPWQNRLNMQNTLRYEIYIIIQDTYPKLFYRGAFLIAKFKEDLRQTLPSRI